MYKGRYQECKQRARLAGETCAHRKSGEPAYTRDKKRRIAFDPVGNSSIKYGHL